ncbi:MAG: 4a-hydroxytetrahydrobiopterin dehydratase [Candidatus Binatia bacterium]
MAALHRMRCRPCDGMTPALRPEEVRDLLAQIPDWRADGDRLVRTWKFRDFVEAMRFVNRMAALAEAEQHHPDFAVHYDRVEVRIWTHAVGGLSRNDFILAAKLDHL